MKINGTIEYQKVRNGLIPARRLMKVIEHLDPVGYVEISESNDVLIVGYHGEEFRVGVSSIFEALDIAIREK